MTAPMVGTSCQGWDGLGGAASWYCAVRGLVLMFQLHSHLSLLLVSGTQGREASILIFISGIGLCLLCRCLAPPHLSPCPSIPLAVQRSPDPTEGQGCPPACKPLSQHWRGQLLAYLCSVPCAAMLGTGALMGGRAEEMVLADVSQQ